MPNPSTIAKGNILGEWVLAVTLSPGVVPPNTTTELAFTVNGLAVGDFIEINKPTVQSGLGIINSRVSAVNTLQIGFGNFTGATITPTANEIYTLTVTRPENLTSAGNSVLAQIT